MTEIRDLDAVKGGIDRNLGRQVTYLLGGVAGWATALYGAKTWCNAKDRSGTLTGDAVCSGFYVRQGMPTK